jgi:subtilisin family serine protease
MSEKNAFATVRRGFVGKIWTAGRGRLTFCRGVGALVGAMILALGMTGCKPAVVTVTPPSVSIEVGETANLQASSTAAEDTSFTWTSANEAVATVDQTGTVTGVTEGGTTVTAQGVSSGSKGEASVTVNRPAGVLSELEITVDPAVVPANEALPPIEPGGEPRPLAAIVDERGNQAEFVENELILVSDDINAVNDLVGRWSGELLLTVDPAESGLDMPQMHLIRIDTSLGDPAQLEADILALDPDARGANRVSTDAGLRLISASAEETVAGLTVGVNWVGRTTSLASGSTQEASTGPSGFSSGAPGYTNNAFLWNHLDSFGVQDIGVTDAWRLLSKAGKLNNKVKVAILDMGFSVEGNLDVPPGWQAYSNVPLVNPIGTENLLSCSGGSDCPYHGTQVMSAAMAVPDNGFGGAGPGGPVAQPVIIFTLYDFFSGIQALNAAAIMGARVANMSYSAPVPNYLFFTVIPFEIATFAASQFMVLLAAAGNDGRNVDAEDCFFVCWEETWHTPCENAGVMCVGGLAKNSKNRASGSNYGAEQVDIFAPYTVIVGPDPSTGPGAHEKSGTSFSAPYVAGVAALLFAANPSLSPSQVSNILINTAHTSEDVRVKRYVNAYAAVAEVLPPVIKIEIPQPGSSGHGGFPVTFEAFVFDDGRGTPTVQWTSSINGVLGTGINITYDNLSNGTHTITARATFPDSSSVQDSVTFSMINDPPSVNITSPANGATFLQGQPVLLAATSTDINNLPDGHLSDAQLSWYVDGVFIGNNHTRTIPAGTLSVGPHTIRLDGTDGELSDTESVSITTNPNPPDLPPDQVNITNPVQGTTLLLIPDGSVWYSAVTLEGNAHDPEDGDLTGTALSWTVSRNGGPAVAFGTGASLAVRLDPFGETTQDITLTATDSAGNRTSTTIRVFQPIVIL